MTADLKNRVFIVTGAAGGIGLATAGVLLEAGAKVALVDLDQAKVEAAVAEVTTDPTHALPLAGDVTKIDSVEQVVADTIARFGRLDGLVNNAGTVVMDPAWDASEADWAKQLEVNVTGSFLCARAVGRHLSDSGGGAIVNVASNCGKVGYPNMAAYNASKAAVISLSRSLATEWADNDINVNAVCPGGVSTPMLAEVADWLEPRLGISSAELLAGMGPAQLGRHVRPEEVGKVIAFLLSDDAKIIRGQAINVDGGDTPY